LNCTNCNSENINSAKFCSKCGKKIVTIKHVDYNKPVLNISIFFFALLIYIIILQISKFGNDYKSVLIADSLFAVIIIIFFIINLQTTLPLFKVKKFKPKILIQLLIGMPILAILVSFLASFLNQNVLNESSETYYSHFQDSPFPLLLSIISIALFPALFEEIAFRGVIFNQSLQIIRLKQSIFISAILFTILHLSILSILWIFPLGLLFGYYRARYNTILYGIIGHFIYNSSIVIFQIIMEKNGF
jgi:membrane protease YdiL (CAAX protease family)